MAVNKYMISKNDDIYEAFPDVVLTKKNDLIAVFLECTHHSDRSYTRVMMTRSSDRGRTWSDKKPFTPASHKKESSFNCPRISRLKDDTLAIIIDCPLDNQYANGKSYLYLGDTDGQKWSTPVLLPSTGIVPDKLFESITGRWIVSTHQRNENNFLIQMMWYSDNRGSTWSEPMIVASQEGLNLCEGSIVEINDKVLVCFLRENSGLGDDCYKSISYDNGNTWQGAYRVPIPACHRPVAGILKSKMYMITHRFMQGGKGWVGFWTQNLFAAFLNESSVLEPKRNGQSVRIFPLDYDRSPVSDIGYSGWVQFEDGEIYVVYYIVDDSPNGQIRGISFYENDVILGGFISENSKN